MSTSDLARPPALDDPRAGTRAARLGLTQVALAGVLWGTGGLAVHLVREVVAMSTLTISAWRMLLAAVVLLGTVLVLRRGRAMVALVRRSPARVLAVALFVTSYQALYFASVVAVGVTVATVVSLGLAPVLLTAAEAVRDRRRPSAARVAVLLAALVGLVLVSGFAGATGPRPVLGVLLAVASGAAYAVGTALSEPLARREHPLLLTAATTSIGALVLVPAAGLVAATTGTPVLSGDPRVLVLLLHLGVLTMALAYALLYAGLRTTSSSAAVLATLLEPVTAAVAAALLLDERLGATGIVGAALVLAAVAGLARPDPRASPA